MTPELGVALLVGGLILAAGGIGMLRYWRQTPTTYRPPEISPAASRHRKRRAARDASVIAGVRLAVALARCDGEVHAREMDAITGFLTEQVKRRDIPWAARMMRTALRDPANLDVDGGLESLAAMDPERRDLVLQLLVHVAQADGVLHPQERIFLTETADRCGLDEARTAELIEQASSPVPDAHKEGGRQEDT